MTMRVIKFSGTAIADMDPIRRAAGIVAAAAEPSVVIVSALAGVTDRLVQIVRFAQEGRLSAACGILERIAERHRRILGATALDASDGWDLVGRTCEEIRALIRTDMALLSVVGEALRTAAALGADLLAALDGVTIHGVSQPPSGLAWTVLVEEADLPGALNRVYERFYPRVEEGAP